MKTRILVLLILLIPSVLFFLGGNCDSNGGGTGSFTYEGTTYPLSQCHLEYVGQENGAHTFMLSALTSDFNFTSHEADITGIGEAYWISLFSPTSTLAEGTYAFTAGEDPNYGDPFTFADLWIMINYNAETDVGDLYMTEAGTLTITEVGESTISLNFEVTLDDGETATGNWSGSINVI